MIPFHKLYLKIFSSLDFDVEKKLLAEFKADDIESFLPIKRSWFYALKLSIIALLAIIFMLINAYVWVVFFESFFAWVFIPASYAILSILFFADTFWYMYTYKKTHKNIGISSHCELLMEKNKVVNQNFIKFFNISVLVSLVLILILIETIIFLVFFYQGEQTLLLWWEMILNIIAGFCIFKHRRLSMNLELDFWFVIPWKVYIIDQTWLLSSKQSIVAVNIKTVEWVYNSILGSMLGYGEVRFFLEGNIPWQKWMVVLDYISSPRKTVDGINKVLWI